MTRGYSAKKAAKCLGNYPEQHAVFIGDSTVREIFWATARALNQKGAADASTKAEKHADLEFKEGKSVVRFIWDPFLNSSQASQYMSRSHASALGSSEGSAEGLVVVGSGLWFAKEDDNSVASFRDAIDALTHHLPLPEIGSKGSQRPMVIPVQPPFYEKLDKDHKPTMTPEKVDAMNEYLEEVAMSHNVNYLSAFLSMVDDMPASAYEPKGLHVMPQIADKQAEVILNLRCNDHERQYTYDGTCCFEYSLDWTQIGLLVSGFGLALVVTWIEFRAWSSNSGITFFQGVEKRQPALWPIFVMWLCLTYCIVADRTHVFNKAQKLYNNQDFFFFIVPIALAGFGSVRQSASPSRPNQEKSLVTDQPFLSRDQTDEWKGWMQALILAYHYTGASKVLWIYKLIRLMVGSYLFMTGYGHAAYFYSKNDFSLKRVVAVNLRVNLLSIALPWFMGTDYLFYYFAPLVTYWYIVVYLTMRIKSTWNQYLPLFILKLFTMQTLTLLFHSQPWLLDPLFKTINTIFSSNWNAKEWMFRCQLDQLIVYQGMLVAVLVIQYSKPTAQSPSPPRVPPALLTPLSVSTILLYAYLSSTRTTKTESNQLHTYISPLPILAFVYLRNCTRALRNHYSAAFAWLGKISLETFVMQYHIWLAADTKGLLSLGVFGEGGMVQRGVLGRGMGAGRWIDCVVLGCVFVWVSARVGDVTGRITGLVVKWMFG